MCYKWPGPRCSGHAAADLERAEKNWKTSRGDNRIKAMERLKEAQHQFDMTPRGQEELRRLIADGKDKDGLFSARLEHGIAARSAALAAIKSKDRGDVEDVHASQFADTNPKLSIPLPDPIGRVYRLPGSPALPTGVNGGVILPSEEVFREKILSGEWVPSITNVVGVRNAEYLQGWAAKMAVEEAIRVETAHPGRLVAKPAAAIAYLKRSHERNRDAAAIQGTKIHYVCEQLAEGREVERDYLTADQWKYVDNYKRWQDDYQPTYISTETTVFGQTEHGGYAGTTDFLAKVNGYNVAGDIKTTRSGLHDDIGYQLAAVSNADTFTLDGETTSPMPRIDAAYGLHLSNRSYSFVPIATDGQVWETFKAERGIWNAHVFHGQMDNGDRILGRPISNLSQVVPNRKNP